MIFMCLLAWCNLFQDLRRKTSPQFRANSCAFSLGIHSLVLDSLSESWQYHTTPFQVVKAPSFQRNLGMKYDQSSSFNIFHLDPIGGNVRKKKHLTDSTCWLSQAMWISWVKRKRPKTRSLETEDWRCVFFWLWTLLTWEVVYEISLSSCW